MKLNPRQAPLYGSCVLTVQLSDEELSEAGGIREDAELFLVFTGSTQRYLSSTLRVSHDTLQAVCPAHDCCESVVVTVCGADPDGLVHQLASERMCFVQDLAFDMAQFLVGAVGRADMLEGALLLDKHQIPLQECEKMDQNLALALSHLTLPPGWSILGNCIAPEPQETLLHFAARRGLQRVARFLLQQPGAQQALALPNKQGDTPASLADSRGHRAMLELFTQVETGTQDSTETHRQIPSGAGVVQHHPCLNTYILALGTQPGTAPCSLQADLQDFRCLMQRKIQGGATLQLQQPESPHTTGECADNPETGQACFEQPQHDSLDSKEQGSTPVCVKGNKTEQGDCCCCPGPLRCRESHSDPAPPSDNSNDDEKRVCTCENTEADYGVQAESTAACVVEGLRKEGDSGDCLQSEFGRESAAHQTSSCGKEGEETDRARESICEAQGSAEGPEKGVHAEKCSPERPEQDQLQDQEEEQSEHKETATGDMGITQSLDTPESSDVESCSQGVESDEEKEKDLENVCLGSLEMEESFKETSKEEPDDLKPAIDQGPITSCEKIDGQGSSEPELGDACGCTCLSSAGTADTQVQTLEDTEINASQVSCEQKTVDNQDLRTEEQGQEGPTQDKTEYLQDVTPVTVCSTGEMVIKLCQEQESDASCHHEGTSDDRTEDTCEENGTLEKPEAPLDTSENIEGERMCHSFFEVDGASSVTLNNASEDNFPLPEGETETDNQEPVASGEPYPEESSATVTGNESAGQSLGSSSEVLQPEIDSELEPQSLTPSSEDTLEPEETDCCSTSEVVQGLSGKDPQESLELGTFAEALLPMSQESQVTLPKGTENESSLESHDSLEGQQRIQDITLQNGLVQLTQEMDLLPPPVENSDSVPEEGSASQTSAVDQPVDEEAVKVGDSRTQGNCCQTPENNERLLEQEQEDGNVSQNPIIGHQSEEGEVLGDTTITQSSPRTITEDQLKLCLDQSDSVGGVLSTSNATDTVDSSFLLQEQLSGTELRSEDSSNPAVVDSGSVDIESTEAREMQETEAEPCDDTDNSALQKDVTDTTDASLEDQVDCQAVIDPDVNADKDVSMIHRERDALCLDSSQASLCNRAVEKRQSSESTESPLSQVRHSTGSTTLRDSGSDTDGFISTDTGDDNVFRKAEEALGRGDSTSEASISCSSTDDTASLGHPSSSAESSEEVRRGGGGSVGGGAGGEAEEEAKDRLTEVPLRSSLLRSTVRSLSPFRRHSWGPGKIQGTEGDMNQRSYSLEGLAADDGKGWHPQRGGSSQGQRGVNRQQSDDRGSQLSLNEALESDLGDHSSLDSQKSKKYRPLRRSCPSMTLPLRQSVSMLSISQRDIDGMRSYSSTSSSLGYSITEEEPGHLRGDFEGKSGTKMSRTISYLKNKMYKKTREKDKEKKGEKEKDAKDKEKKTVNGHLFSSMSFVHSALCQHCNKALNAKDAVSCTSCSVCVHKSCRDNIPACTKGKFQKQQLAIPESTTMPGVTLRAKSM
uniref:Phorbol-ester/DAG-type domain-containing protein n=1 Tax=Astyanax mexicanus TaxID=7994 RepID=A0A8B9J8G3_ASTMX